MEGGGESSGRGSQRRTWSSFEEESLLTVLEGLVAKGQRCDTGNFKAGTLNDIAAQLKIFCPESSLQAYPHVESKLKFLKANYSIIYDMLNTSGFAWNDVKKCVEVDSNEAWDKYAQHHKDARKWRNKSYPLYDRLANIFGKDRANGKAAEVPNDMIEEHSNIGDADFEDDLYSISMDKAGSHQSVESKKGKRKRSEKDKLICVLEKAFAENGKTMQLVADALTKANDDRSDIVQMLKAMGLSTLDTIKAMQIILEKPQNICLFKSLDDEMRRVYVQQLLAGK